MAMILVHISTVKMPMKTGSSSSSYRRERGLVWLGARCKKKEAEFLDVHNWEKVLKGPKREIFDSGVFAQIRPIWIGDLGTRPKNYKF
jgi:hypothetical protein